MRPFSIQHVVSLEWLILLLLLPFAIVPSVALLPLFLVVPAIWLGRRTTTGRWLPATPLNPPLMIMLLMIGVSLGVTFDLSVSMEKVVGLTYGICLYWAAVAFVTRRPQNLYLLVLFVIACGLGVVALALLGTNWVPKVPVVGAIARLVDSLQPSLPAGIPQFNANQVAGVLLWVAPLATAVTVASWNQSPMPQLPVPVSLMRFTLLASTFLLLFTLVLTQSRSGYLGLALSFLLMALLVPGRWRNRVTWLMMVALLGGAIVVVTQGTEAVTVLLFEATGVETVGDGDIRSLRGRMEIWSRAWMGIQDFPITGMGMGTFRHLVHVYYPTILIPEGKDFAHAHNHLLQTALDLGVLGLVAYVAIWLHLIGLLWRCAPAIRRPFERAVMIGGAGSLAGYWIYAMTDAVALGAKPGFIFWLLLACVVGLHHWLVVENSD